MKVIRTIFIFLIVSLVFSAQFEIVKDITGLSGDPAAQKYAYRDVNGNWCAILKVHTNVKELQFESMGYEKHDYYQEGIYLVYLQPETKNIKFKKDGYIPKNHEFPFKLKSNTVYMIEINGVADQQQMEDITINILVEPENAVIFLDGEDKGSISNLTASVGRHELKISKDGFRSVVDTIEVKPANTLFKYKMERIEEASLLIDSEPAGAKAYIDGVQIGRTPVSTFYPPGTYRIRLSFENYEDIEEAIEITTPETKKKYQLNDIRATLTINTNENAKVYLNGVQLTELIDLKLTPQRCVVRVEMNKSKPLEKIFILKKKENKTLDLFPVISTGTIRIEVIPPDAKIELTEDGREKYSDKGSKTFSNIPVGVYNLKVSKKGFKNVTQEINLTADAFEKKGIKLEPGSDYVLVQGYKAGDFYIGKTEVTQAQWKTLMGNDPSRSKGDDLPVESVTWYEAVEFCNKLSETEMRQKCYSGSGSGIICDFSANGYRLPTEAEWEYAAKGGKRSGGYKYSGSNSINDVGWCFNNTENGVIQPVETKKPNELGIHDMSGNVEEWCWDGYADGSIRVVRGGCSAGDESGSLITLQNYYPPDKKIFTTGFRVVRHP
ncbi:MAG TPA: SUMF1/EgtB/PvdO family nonheme iron enzyme [Clostridiales bacterium]|nr:SUMF1/EgtB/PvdO family nonheme iron enzyme [Clostridiales bacterium]HQP68816.1 SUMF1/EgtB/PvdO family nonheme iron enzyme [Clostridiales bacterium]